MKQELLIHELAEEIKKKKEEIKRHLSTKSNLLEITVDDYQTAIAKESKEPKLEMTERGLHLSIASPAIYQELKDILPKSLVRLAIPISLFPSLEEIKEFPNLKELDATEDHSFTKEELDILSDTSVKRLTSPLTSLVQEEVLNQKGTVGIQAAGQHMIEYQDLLISNNSAKLEYLDSVELSISDVDDLDKLTKLIDKTNLKRVLPKGVNISLRDKNSRNEVWGILESSRSFSQEYHLGPTIINTKDYREIEKILDWIAPYKIETIGLTLKNETNPEIKRLEKFSNLPLEVMFDGQRRMAPLEDFISMRTTIDYYKELITEEELSPAENLLYAYDIIKSFVYQESKENPFHSRELTSIIKTGNIVCVGYANFLTQLAKELGIPITSCSVTCMTEEGPQGHERNIVNLDDDKYQIHGVFIVDATADSRRDELSLVLDEEKKPQIRYHLEEKDLIQKQYHSLSLYHNFLIPYSDYEKEYINDTKPELFRLVDGEPKDELYHIKYEKADLFNHEISDEEMISKIKNTQKPSLDTFTTILTTIREKEGYQSEVATNVKETIELNQMIDKLYRENASTFFKEKNK